MLKLLWIVYAIFGFLVTVALLLGEQSWFALTVALCFIFGPKVWKNL